MQMDWLNQLNYKDAKQIGITKQDEILIPGTKHFCMRDFIKTGTLIGDYRVTYVGKSFMKHFGAIEEQDIPDLTVSVFQICQWGLDTDVIQSLGGKEAISDSYLYHLISIIKMGAKGPGIFNGYTNLFYKKSPIDGQLWSPHFYLRGDRLGFGALPACYDDGWEPGDQVYLANV